MNLKFILLLETSIVILVKKMEPLILTTVAKAMHKKIQKDWGYKTCAVRLPWQFLIPSMAKVKTNWSNSFHLTTTHRLITLWFLKRFWRKSYWQWRMCNTTQSNVADITVDDRYPKTRIVPPRRKVWKLRNPAVRKDYEIYVN